jgi:cytochrome c oxidase subunit 2
MNWMKQASISAQKSDAVFLFVFALAVVLLVATTAVMIWFVVRYDRRRHPQAAQIEGNTLLEVVWTLVPAALFVGIFYYGWTNFDYMRRPPRDSLEVRVTGRQWNWSYLYPNGKQTTVLFAPLNRPLKLDVVSTDVVHGFFVPAFRLKMDAVPGRTNSTWFQATRTGSYDVLCTVICGVDHSAMLSKVVVVPEEDFRAWYFGGEDAPEPAPPAEVTPAPVMADEHIGLTLMRTKGCLTCHSVDGTPMVGPTLKGILGRREEVVADGTTRTVAVDEQRIRSVIRQPGREVVKGYPASMPVIPMEDEELEQVVQYLKYLK